MSPPLPQNDRRGVTLVEILLAIAVIAVIFTLLIPVSSGVRRYSQTTKCLANIRTYGVALLTYVADHGGVPIWDRSTEEASRETTPQFNKWLTGGRYLSADQPLRCPLADGKAYDHINPRYRFPYSPNMALCATYPRMSGFPVPAHRVALVAEVNDWDGYTSYSTLNKSIWRGNDAVGTEGEVRVGRVPVARYHGTPARRGLHFFFADGSAHLVYPEGNDWSLAPTCAPMKGIATTGYFYHSTHYNNMKEGTLTAP